MWNWIRRVLRRIFTFREDVYVSEATLRHVESLEQKTGWEGPTYDGKYKRD